MKKSTYVLWTMGLLATLIICLCIGSVKIPLTDLAGSFARVLARQGDLRPIDNIIFQIRIPRILGAGLVGASLALAGAIMQGVLKNPLADGSTLGVSSAASLGAALAMVTGFSLPGLAYSGVVILAIAFALGSLVLIISLSYKIDHTISNHTIILMGIIFSMLTSSAMNLLMMAFREDLQNIFSWTMGSLAGTSYQECLILAGSLLIFGLLGLAKSSDLNAFALGEDKARNIGVDVSRSKKLLLISASSLVGVSVAMAGNIAFVGIIIPHIIRYGLGPNYRTLLPLSLFLGSSFLMVADLISRTLFSPIELPIGTITSIVGTLVFILIYFRGRK